MPVQNRAIVIGTGYPPYYLRVDGAYSGFCIEIVDAVAEQIGITLNYSEYP